jgi:hypothetical protein
VHKDQGKPAALKESVRPSRHTGPRTPRSPFLSYSTSFFAETPCRPRSRSRITSLLLFRHPPSRLQVVLRTRARSMRCWRAKLQPAQASSTPGTLHVDSRSPRPLGGPRTERTGHEHTPVNTACPALVDRAADHLPTAEAAGRGVGLAEG